MIDWAINDHMRTDLVEAAVAMRGELAEQVVLHADRGCQYTSGQQARFAHNPQPSPLSGPYRGVLGQCAAVNILGHNESRVL